MNSVRIPDKMMEPRLSLVASPALSRFSGSSARCVKDLGASEQIAKFRSSIDKLSSDFQVSTSRRGQKCSSSIPSPTVSEEDDDESDSEGQQSSAQYKKLEADRAVKKHQRTQRNKWSEMSS